MLGGVVIPVELFPETMQRVLAWTPFPYVLDFPVRVMIGRIEGIEMLAGFGDPAVLDRRDRRAVRLGLAQIAAGNIRRPGREGRMKRYFKLIALFIRATVQVQLEYRSGAVGRVIANLLSTAHHHPAAVGDVPAGRERRRLELRSGAGADRHRDHHRLRGGGLALSQPQQDHRPTCSAASSTCCW